MIISRRQTQAAVILAAAASIVGASAANAGPNHLANGGFDQPSGTGPTTLTGQNVSGPSAASHWLTFNNSDATTRTEQLPSTKLPGGTMMHVITTGPYNGLYQTFAPANGTEYVCAWIYVVTGNVALGAGDGANTVPSAVLLKAGSWEVLNVSNANAPVSEVIVYSNSGPAEFVVESAGVSTDQAQCKPR